MYTTLLRSTGLTVWCSFSIQIFTLWREGQWLWGGATILLSVVLCLFAVRLGYIVVTAVVR
jgi:fluoride ion exporter CrcB/FEX